MTVGMPGTGIGGLFYLASALCMPLREAYRAARRRPAPRRWRLVLRQSAIFLGGVAGIWAAGWLLGVVVRGSRASSGAAGSASGDALSQAIPQWAALIITVGTLVGVLLGVELLRLILGAGSAQPAAAAARAWAELSDSGRQRAATAAAKVWAQLSDSGRQRVAVSVAWAELTESRRRRAAAAARLTLLVLGLLGVAARTAPAQAAMAIEPIVGGSHDSDGNEVWRFTAAVDIRVAGPTRLGLALGHTDVSDGFAKAAVDELSLRANSRPRTGFRLDAAAGAVRPDPGTGTGSDAMLPAGSIRARWRASGGATALDLRARHDLLDASPTLVASRVRRTELRAMGQVPALSRLRLRGVGRAAALRTDTEVNHQTAGSAIVALALSPTAEVSGQFHQAGYSRPSEAGYFAPRLSQTVEIGSYLEIETTRLAVVLDLGAGVQRLAEHGGSVGSWARALRLYSFIAVPLAPGRQLALEVEAHDGIVGTETAGGASWRQLSAALSLRWAFD